MCHPYDKQEDYFYPARRQISFFCGAIILQLPYVLDPYNTTIWEYIRVFYILYYPMAFSMIYGRYFRRKRLNHNWSTRLLFFIPITVIIGLFVSVMVCPDNIKGIIHSWAFYGIIITMGVILFISYNIAFLWIKKQIDTFHEQNYSNVEDFPFHFARQVTYMPLIWIILGWSVSITGSRDLKVITDIVMSLWMIAFVCKILYPQRMLRDEDIEQELVKIAIKRKNLIEEDTDSYNKSENNIEQKDEDNQEKHVSAETVEHELMTIINQRYAEPDLKRTDILSDLTPYKRQIADNIISRVGFYQLVNLFRLKYFDIRMLQDPHIDKEMTAIVCGFKDYTSLCHTRKRISKLHDEETAREIEKYVEL